MKLQTKKHIGGMMKRAVLYARVSGDDRKYATSGVDGQLDDCRKYANEKGTKLSMNFLKKRIGKHPALIGCQNLTRF